MKTGGASSAFYIISIGNTAPGDTIAVKFIDALNAAQLDIYGQGTVRQIAFATGLANTHNVTFDFNLYGGFAELTMLVPATPGETWYLNLTNPVNLNYLKPSYCTLTGAVIDADNSYNGGNNVNWDFGPITFEGTGNWNDPANWGNGRIPDKNDALIISGDVSLAGAIGVIEVKNISIDPGHSLDLSGHEIRTTQGLVNEGNLILTGNENIASAITLAAGCTVTYTGADEYSALKLGNAYSNLVFDGNGTWQPGADLTVAGDFKVGAGTFDLGGKTLTVSGDFTAAVGATFDSGAGTVKFAGSGTSYIHGTVFANLEVTTPGKELVIDAGAIETVKGTLTLTGTAAQPIILKSGTDGSQWNIDPQGTRSISYVSVKDSNNINSTPINGTGLIDLGNNIGWNFPQTPRPTPSGHNIPIQESDLMYLNPFLSTGGVGGMMMMTPAGAVVIVAAPVVAPIAAPMAGPLPATAIAPMQEMFREATSAAIMAQIASPEVFGEAFALVRSQAPAEFIGIGVTSYTEGIMAPAEFEGINSKAVFLPKPSFNETIVTMQFEPIVKPYIFNGAEPVIQMPQPATFTGVKVQTTGLQLAGSDTFKEIRCAIYM